MTLTGKSGIMEWMQKVYGLRPPLVSEDVGAKSLWTDSSVTACKNPTTQSRKNN